MHKSFYASGFLYHSPSRQILLQQLTRGSNTNLVLFREKSHNGQDPQTVFQHCIEKALGIKIAATSIHSVYEYVHDTLGEQFVFFIEGSGISPATYPSNTNAGWFSLAKLAKLTMSEQTRHDIIIGERVIRAWSDPRRTSL
ncbi:hypothetical protein HY411_02635 [Candidatus Gottesmanbacteria bacterium]|nr:hypothetical protein [Candidatus Gottesmanbacteria bacterium]